MNYVSYSIRRWPLKPHYYVTLFGTLPKGFQRIVKFNTPDEAQKHIRALRRRLKRYGLELRAKKY